MKRYEEFVEYVREMGVVAFSGRFIQGFPKLQDLTAEEQWHTGDPETDPWQWKDRVAAEKKLAFGCLLGGKKGFLSPELYPLFYRACRPRYTVEEQYELGTASPVLREVARLFDRGGVLSTADIRGAMNATKKTGASRVDRAVETLQRDFLITVCGNRRKVGARGQEYGWPANTYCRVEDWFPDWTLGAQNMGREEAREAILDHCGSWGGDLDLEQLERLLFRR